MLSQLKNLNLERLALDDALAIYAFGKLLQSEYDAFQVDTPEWLTENMASLKREIQDRVRDELLRGIKLDEAQVESYKSAADKRKEAQRRIDERKNRLAAMG
jgi:hypothetical protein